MEISELRFSCGTLESSHERELKGSISMEYRPRIIVICVILQASMISGDDFLQTLYDINVIRTC